MAGPRTVPIESMAPNGPAARWYASPAIDGTVDDDPSRRAIADEVAVLATELGLPPPLRDGRLDRVADVVARTQPLERQPSFELVSFLLSHHGIVEPEPHLQYGRTDVRTPRGLVELARPGIAESLREARRVRLGVGVFRQGDELTVVMAFQAQHLELRPVPRVLAPGLVAHVEGRLEPGLSRPQVFVTAADGTVDELRVKGTAAHFETALGCRSDAPGVFQLEIAADGAQGPAVLANFPIYCAVEPPTRSPPLAIDTSGDESPEEVEAQLLVLVNRDRKRQGLSPVRLDDRLAEVARAHSREMARTGVVAHVSPRSGNVADRLRRARLEVSLVGENVGRDYSAAAAQRGFMLSPGHRANIIDPRMTTVGIGVVRGQSDNGPVPLFITQIFAAGLK